MSVGLSMVARRSPFFTTSPSRTLRSSTDPATFALTVTRSSASTVAVAYTASMAEPRTTAVVVTGLGRSRDHPTPDRTRRTATAAAKRPILRRLVGRNRGRAPAFSSAPDLEGSSAEVLRWLGSEVAWVTTDGL